MFICFLQAVLISWLLKLACACLSFDFIGTSTDESADDLAMVQIPTAWRSTFLDCTTLQLFFNLFHSLSAELAHMVRPPHMYTPINTPHVHYYMVSTHPPPPQLLNKDVL